MPINNLDDLILAIKQCPADAHSLIVTFCIAKMSMRKQLETARTATLQESTEQTIKRIRARLQKAKIAPVDEEFIADDIIYRLRHLYGFTAPEFHRTLCNFVFDFAPLNRDGMDMLCAEVERLGYQALYYTGYRIVTERPVAAADMQKLERQFKRKPYLFKAQSEEE